MMRKLCSVLIPFLLVPACATVYNPVTRRDERTLYTVEQEIELGKRVAKEIEKELHLLNDEAGYVERVGQLVAANSDRPDLPYTFKVVDSDELNAFAIPGGYVYIYKGLLDDVDESELASVLGHEIAHICARHGIKKIQSIFGYQLVAVVAMVALGDESEAAEIQGIADTIFTMILLGYSREDELQADRLGTLYVHYAGYDPRGTLRLLEKLREEERGDEITFISTHPPIDERIREAEIVVSSIESE